MSNDIRVGWHFVNEEHVLGYRDRRKVRKNVTLEMRSDGKPVKFDPAPCAPGMHASTTLEQAHGFGKGPVACLVLVWGDIVDGDTKFCGRFRRVLGMKNIQEMAWKIQRPRSKFPKNPDDMYEFFEDEVTSKTLEKIEKLLIKEFIGVKP